MTKHELTSWSNLGQSVAIIGYYLIRVLGFSEHIPVQTDEIISLLFELFIVAVILEIVVALWKYFLPDAIDKTEREEIILLKGYKVGYSFVMGALAIIAFQWILVTHVFSGLEFGFLDPASATIFHVLIVIFLGGEILKSATQIFYFRTA